MKHALFIFLGLAALTAAVAQSPAHASTTLTGVLHTGIVAIGGDTTGRVLEYNDPQAQKKTIEVEITAQTDGAGLATDGAHVTVTGPIVVHHYIERGDVPRIVASEIKADKSVEP
jgi:predicted Na+-dependent transporter